MLMLNDLLDFFFPRYCVLCGKRLTKGEQHLCLPCYMHLPRTMYHTVEHGKMEKLFWGTLPVERATAFFHYTDATKEMLIQLKYNSYPQLGEYLASQFAREIEDSGFFEDIDIIVPVPLHWLRRMRRGYNQSEYIAQGISKVVGIPVCTKAVRRTTNNKSQTLMHKTERKENVDNIFKLLHPCMLENKHVLIIDDVTTTGATISSLAKEIVKAQNTKLSVLTLSIAGQTPVPPNDLEPLPSVSIKTETVSRL